ncbi:EAL domain-containing protein [Parasulfuritortus cantonensis]|uniref:EAL domain-containing protein n=1 Tax=Parasulfuritortus cantonensis TaxID=2528202 RepID=A0A4R1BA98_9PROT|nr:EAL domain-containing protein [Parasulfuritortus cantonensis]TCJ13860.1 EAL domain-containing protein [Parasulfuritortus cantonensis]
MAWPDWLDPRKSFRLRLVLVVIVLVVVLFQGAAYFNRNAFVEQVRTDKGLLLAEIAHQMAGEMDKGVADRLREIGIMASLPILSDPGTPLADKQAMLDALQASYRNYAWIGFTDAEGNILAGTGGLLVGKNVAKRAWFIEGARGPAVGDVHDAFLLAKILPKPEHDFLPLRLLDVSAPIRDRSGHLLGVMCGHLSWDWSYQVKNALLAPLQSHAKVDVLIVGRQGQLLLGTPALHRLAERFDLASLRAARAGRSGFLAEAWPDGETYLTGYAPSTGHGTYRGLGWTVLVRQPAGQAFAVADTLQRRGIVTSIVFAVAFAVVLWYSAGRLVEPMRRIAAAAVRIRERGGEGGIPVLPGADELAVLSRSLADMVGTLEAQKGELADKNQQLQLSAQVFSSSTEGIIITDAEERILSINQAYSEITGYRLEEVIGKTPRLLASGRQDKGFYAAMWGELQRHGRWQGEVWNRRKDGEVYPEWLIISRVCDAAGAVSHYIGIFTDITERKRAEERILHLANHDVLTDLPNRLLYLEQLNAALIHARRQHGALAVLFVDLDRFKNVNDSLGHHIGDLLLLQVAKRLAGTLDAGGFVARWGGDEFVVFIPDLRDTAVAARLAERINALIATPFQIGDSLNLSITSSVGIAIYPDDGTDVVTLTKNADAAMYYAKENGRDNYQFFTREINQQVNERLLMENALRQALAQGQLEVYYQPQVALPGLAIVGVEALLRWHHPEWGMVSPGRFIPVAEETGLIVPIGEWVLREACAQQLRWRDEGLAVRMAVNLSSVQFQHGDLAGLITGIVTGMGAVPENIELEITESVVLDCADCARDTLTRLHELGFSIAMDDFGTGYSSLSYINQLPLDRIKIDQSFVRDITSNPQSSAIASAVVAMARSLDLQVIAEGVETAEQLEYLRLLECEELQGYLFGRPQPADAIGRLLRGDPPG